MNPELIQIRRPSPPSFEEAQNRRQKARAAGMNPDYWYPVEWEKNLKRGQAIEVMFWKESIALWRGEDDQVRAVENRCIHRQLKLSLGVVEGCNLTCAYHGWQFDGGGKCVHIPHDMHGQKLPDNRLRHYPVQVKHGLIWIYPGDQTLMPQRSIPEIPELSLPQGDRWGLITVDDTWKGHHSMILDNVSDFTHAFLHRKYKPFSYDSKLTRLETKGDTVELEYDTNVGAGGITKYFVNRSRANTGHMKLAYEYPYQRSNTDDRIKHWCFVLPMDEQTSRAFFVFYFSPDLIQIPFLNLRLPFPVRTLIMEFAQRLQVRPLIAEDKIAVEAEQEGYNRHYQQPIAEVNPAVHQFQSLTIRKWEEHLAKANRS